MFENGKTQVIQDLQGVIYHFVDTKQYSVDSQIDLKL